MISRMSNATFGVLRDDETIVGWVIQTKDDCRTWMEGASRGAAFAACKAVETNKPGSVEWCRPWVVRDGVRVIGV